MNHSRRAFIGTTATGVAGARIARSLPAARAQSADARIEILLDEPIGTLAPEIYGHFVEHLGGVIYDGIWVGEKSRIANTGGIRRAAIDAFKSIQAPVIRWPGGCFADSYDWRDGIGPAAGRSARTNFWGGTDPNTFGTHEFIRLCE